MAGIAGCSAITIQCSTVSVVTVGGLAIPCSLFVAAACTAVGGAASAYAEMCPK